MTQSNKITNYLTIDVEEHFQVAAFEDIVNPKDWEIHESRVVKNTNLILDLLKKHKTKATFFIVGWTAERHPDMVREIAEQGHDIGPCRMGDPCFIAGDDIFIAFFYGAGF